MTCNNVKILIPAIISGEIKGRQRILALAHIRGCDSCRSEYEVSLKTFYLLQKETVRAVPSSTTKDFTQDLLVLTREEKPGKTTLRAKWILTAAALLIIGFMLGQSTKLIKSIDSGTAQSIRPNSLTVMLQNEDWQQLFRVLSSPLERAELANEEIPIGLLIDKLNVLQQKGLEVIDLRWFSLPRSSGALRQSKYLATEQLKQLIVNNTIKTGDLIYLLKQVTRYKKEISLSDISNIVQTTSERILL